MQLGGILSHFANSLFYVGQASATKPAQEEEKQKGDVEETRPYDLPVITQELTFKGLPLLITDAEGKTKLNKDAVFALVAALTLSVKDVFRFAEKLTLADPGGPKNEQIWEMQDCRTHETRGIYALAVLDFINVFLAKDYMELFRFPPAHIAAVLVHLYNQRY